MLARVKSLWRDEEGQGMVEYGLILAAIAVVVMAALFLLGPQIRTLFEDVGDELPDAPA